MLPIRNPICDSPRRYIALFFEWEQKIHLFADSCIFVFVSSVYLQCIFGVYLQNPFGVSSKMNCIFDIQKWMYLLL